MEVPIPFCRAAVLLAVVGGCNAKPGPVLLEGATSLLTAATIATVDLVEAGGAMWIEKGCYRKVRWWIIATLVFLPFLLSPS